MGRTKKARPEDSDPKFIATKAEVLKRDNYKCQLCFKKRKKLQVHHIIKYSKSSYLRTDKFNLITLCIKCHKSIARKEHLYEQYFFKRVNANAKN